MLTKAARALQIAGKWLKGARLRGGSGTLSQRLVGVGYAQLCGDAEIWGDGVVPVASAHLEGAVQLRANSTSAP